jgi:penicillin-binding protein 2
VLLHAERLAPASAPRWEGAELPLDPAVSRRIVDGMWGSVVGGTSHNAGIPGLDICGKTGTVQVIGNERKKELKGELSELKDHSWFVGFARRDQPEIAVVVFLEHGGKGGIAAAPLAKEIFAAFYARRAPADRRNLTSERRESGPAADPRASGGPAAPSVAPADGPDRADDRLAQSGVRR